MEVIEKISDKLRSLRNERDMTLQAMADAIGMSLRSYQALEYDQTHPSFETVMKIIKGLRISPDELFEYKTDETLSEFLLAWQNAEPKRRDIALEILRGEEASTKSKKA